MVSSHTHTDVALGEGKRQGGLWLRTGLEPEFPLRLGLVSLPLTFLGDPCWFLPSLGLRPPRREIPRCWRGNALGRGKGRLHRAQALLLGLKCLLGSVPTAVLGGSQHTRCSRRAALSAGDTTYPRCYRPSPPGQAVKAMLTFLLAKELRPRESSG